VGVRDDYETIHVEIDADGVAVLTFDRPEVRNALNLVMVGEIREALGALRDRPGLQAVILQGAGGKAFLGGADIAELRRRDHLDALRRINSELFREVERFPAPTIAAIQGFALGGGCELAMACDLRVCGAGARLGQPEVGLGIIPGAGATYRLPRLVGHGRARELIYTGRIIGADEAERIGLVNRVVPDAEVLPAARALAHEIARNSALAVRLAKQSLRAAAEAASSDALQALESAAQGILFEHEEKQLRMQAFLERKRARKAEPETFSVSGLTKAELRLGFAELSALPASQQVPDVGVAIPGRRGRAVRLDVLLDKAGRLEGASHVQVTSKDGRFSSSQPTEVMDRALVVYALHGDPLPEPEGGPFRLLIPDAPDPCANVKQIARIELLGQSGDNTCTHSPEEHERMEAASGGR